MAQLAHLVWPFLISFVISAVSGPLVIPVLRKMKFGQSEREEGVKSHLKKAGTPTMGGVIILLGFLVGTLAFVWKSPKVLIVVFMTLGFGCVGFLDDYLKVVKHNTDGLTPLKKLGAQFVIMVVFIILLKVNHISMALRIPFAGKVWDIGFLSIPLLFFAVLGTVNAVNFTDGLDGLASMVTAVVAVFFGAASVLLKGGVEIAACAALGGLLGFLLYNVYPAKVFMGDTGSLALGGFVVSMAYMLQMPLFILIVGFIYLAEIVSVMMQVTYFKLTHGKRIFKMTPIHHHFELCDWSETRIVTVFSIITMILSLIGLLAI